MLKPIPIEQRQGSEAEKKAAYEADVKEMKANPGAYGGEFSGAVPAQQVVLTGVRAVNEQGEQVKVVKAADEIAAKLVAKEEKSDRVKVTEGK